MRKPTPPEVAYAWHREALTAMQAAGARPQALRHEARYTTAKALLAGLRFDEDPKPGWYTRRLVRGGPRVACRIWLHQEIDPETGELTAEEYLRCEVCGRKADPDREWTYLCHHPITAAEFNFMTADKAWAEVNAPDDPAANERKAIDHTKTPLPF